MLELDPERDRTADSHLKLYPAIYHAQGPIEACIALHPEIVGAEIVGAVCGGAPARLEAKRPWYQRLRPLELETILVEPLPECELEGVAKALGRNERGACAATLNDGVRRQRRAVNDEVEPVRRDARLLKDKAHAGDDAFLRRASSRLHHVRDPAIGRFENNVGECPAYAKVS